MGRARSVTGRRQERGPTSDCSWGPLAGVRRARGLVHAAGPTGGRAPRSGTWTPRRRQVGAGSSWSSDPGRGRSVVRAPRVAGRHADTTAPRWPASFPGPSVLVEQRRRRRLVRAAGRQQRPQPLDGVDGAVTVGALHGQHGELVVVG